MDIYKTQLHINYQKKKFDKPEREEEDFGDGKNQPLIDCQRSIDRTDL